ncbi:MAG: DNA-binding protein WhiA [Bacillota bacterium]
MTFSSIAKNEISKIVIENKCCQIAELSALIKMTGTIQIQGSNNLGIRLSTENASIARRLFTMLKNNFDIHTKVIVRKNKQLKKNNNYTLYIDYGMGSENILKSVSILTDSPQGKKINYRLPVQLIKKSCCKKAYLRGAFLGGGSVSDPEKAYHLEIVTTNEAYSEDLKKLINSYDLNAKVVERKGNYVVYLKEGEQIVDLLNIIGAHNALLNFENTRIYKEMRNNVNRIVNCETANLNKTVNAAMRQIENIRFVIKKIGLDKMPQGLSEIAELRLKYPDVSLKELGELMNPPIGKSGVNHRLRKLDELAATLRTKLNE